MQKQDPVSITLTDAQIDQIANRAVEKLEARVGRTVIRRAAWIAGLGVSALVSLAFALWSGS